jgi:hypothetical protein
MLRLVTLAAATVIAMASLELRPVHASSHTASLDLEGGVPATARAVRSAVKKHGVQGNVWLGKLRGVGGRRDTLVYVPSTLDTSRTIDVVVYMEGIDSFADKAIDKRHVASMARLAGNSVYVAPDSPSSHFAARQSGNEHWQPGCADRVCPGGRSAPGDFLVFFDAIRTRLANMTDTKREALDLRLSLIGFSRGGKGALRALEQLAEAKFEVRGLPVRIADVVYADGNYLENALGGAWNILASRPEQPRLTILVEQGEFTERGGPDSNRRRALAFWKTVAPDAPLPTATGAVSVPRLRLIPLAGGHYAIGDAAVDFLGFVESKATTS